MQKPDTMTTRIHASHLRKMLLHRNQSATFKRLLSLLSDDELLLLDKQNHERKLVATAK